MKKKLFSLVLIGLAAGAVATNLQMWYKGPYESTADYRVKPLSSTSATAPVVLSESALYIANGASTPIRGVKPASQPAAWTKIGVTQ